MKQPFWILNSILLIFLFLVLWFVFWTRIKIPLRQDITPESYIPVEKKEIHKLDIGIIYKNDLFGTYTSIVEPEKPEISSEIPSPPEPVQIYIPESSEPQFLEPLPLTLTGIIIQTDESKNRAFILDNKTNKQSNYKTGDEIEDAQIIRIFKNKIILIRSNGQQEVLYVHQSDVKNEINKTQIKDIVTKISDFQYIIDLKKFISYVNNLPEFIELLDLKAAYKQGQIVGDRIGKLEPDSLGILMGLQSGDIIQKINSINIKNTNNRFEIYKQIISLNDNEDINVEILRQNSPISITYKLKKYIKKSYVSEIENKNNITDIQNDPIELIQAISLEDEKTKILKEKNKFAPTIHEIRIREKQNIFKQSKSLQQQTIE